MYEALLAQWLRRATSNLEIAGSSPAWGFLALPRSLACFVVHTGLPIVMGQVQKLSLFRCIAWITDKRICLVINLQNLLYDVYCLKVVSISQTP